MTELHIGQTNVPYEIEWSGDRETITLSFDASMELTVRAPFSASPEDVEGVLEDKKSWILETLYGLSEQSDPPLDKEFLSGEKLLYRGRRYPLSVNEADVPQPIVKFDEQDFDLRVPAGKIDQTEAKRQAVVDWYINQANNELPLRVDEYAQKIGVSPLAVEVRDMTRQWGEYQSGEIRLHWRLILAPRRIQDYVVVHELAHDRHPDHDDSFWNTVGTFIPDYEDRREWLRIHGNTLTV